MRTRLRTLSAALILTAVAVGACSSDDDDAKASTATTDVTGADLPKGTPEPTGKDAASTLDFLAGDGAPLLVMHTEAAALAARTQTTPADCEKTAGELDRAVPADDALALTSQVADPVLRAAFVSERSALGVAVTACISEPAGLDDERCDGLNASAGTVTTRLAQLEATR